MQKAAIILCGGKSSRMGHDKATLPFGPEVMLQRVIRLLSEVVEPGRIVVVAAPDQQLPSMPAELTVTFDHRPGRGPLEGLSAGLSALPEGVDAAYVTSCDVPLLVPEFVTQMFELLGDSEIAVPCEGGQFHPLAAVYRPSVLKRVQKLLAADQLRPRFLFDEAVTRAVQVDELRAFDPQLLTLLNLNRPEDYRSALKIAGWNDQAQLEEIWPPNSLDSGA